jgi:precorrin-8X/cobalt-precorrin-8 methylmutase
MPLFDRYIAVDWSASNVPKRGKDSIWIADSQLESTNPRTRTEAMAEISARLVASRAGGERVFAGFDFPFGYPWGSATAITGRAGWQELWSYLAARVTDGPDNSSNRFAVGGMINRAMAEGGPRFWGHHSAHAFDGMTRTRPLDAYRRVDEKRLAEASARTAQPVWKLYGIGSVGSQAILGIYWLERLRRDPALQHAIAIWPFETKFCADLSKPIVVAEIYPSIVPAAATAAKVKDQVQVENMVELFAAADARGELKAKLDAPTGLTPSESRRALEEEGWIVGVPA